jgi:hypothetical protein
LIKHHTGKTPSEIIQNKNYYGSKTVMSTDKTIAEIGYDLDLNIQPTSLDFSKTY